MAYRLAAAGKTVCLLERGKPFAPGSFPRTPREIRNNFWRPETNNHGLFDVWSFADAEAIVSAGLGGGSLIYANVLIRKDANWFVQHGGSAQSHEDWPLRREDLEQHYIDVEKILKPEVYPSEYQRHNKTAAMRAAAHALNIQETTWDNVNPSIPQWYLPQLAVTFRDGAGPPERGRVFDAGESNLHRKPRETCRLCGECDIGCNYGAKNSLDYNYLSFAQARGADIRTCCEATTIVPRGSNRSMRYDVSYIEHGGGDGANAPTHTISGDRVVVACGTLGTAHLLMRNRTHLRRLGPMLGKRFSGNGDYLAFALRASQTAGRKTVPRHLNASRAPVITSTFRFPDALDGARGRGAYLQDAGYPLAGDYLWELTDPGADLRRTARFMLARIMAGITHDADSELGPEIARLLGTGDLSACSMPLLGMGRDQPNGTLRLDRRERLQIAWPERPSKPYYDRLAREAKAVTKQMGARYAQNPLMKTLNRLITVHPLGGCPMGRSRREGVVDSFGEVFGHPGLYVADGSVMPGPVGANPSLTIAALSDRFATHMLETWERTACDR